MSSSSSKSSFVNIASTGGSQSSLDEDEFSTISSTPLPNDVSGIPVMDDMPSPIPSDAEETDLDVTANIDLKTRNTEMDTGENKTLEEGQGRAGEGSSSNIEELNSIIKTLQEKVASQEDQIFDILVENSVLKDQVEQKKKRENSAHLQLVMNLQQTIVDQAMTMKDQNLKIKILSSQLETLKLAKVEEPKQRVVLSGEGKPMDEGIAEKKRVSILRIRSVPVSSYWPAGETRIVKRKDRNLELLSEHPMKEVEKSWSKFCIKDSESPQTSRPPTLLDQKSLLTKSQSILNPETLKSELAETEKQLSENPTSSVLEQKILEVEYANQQISMIIETNDLQKAEDDSRHEEEMQVLRDKIEDLEKVIQCLKKIRGVENG